MMYLGAVLAVLALPPLAQAADWPQQGGPQRGNFTPERLPVTIPAVALPALAWVAMAGLGSSPPAVAGGRVYVLGSFAPDADLGDGHQPEEWLDHLDKSRQHLKSKGGASAGTEGGEKEKHGDAYVLGSDHL